MISVLACLSTQHDIRIVAMAATICCIGSFAAMRLFAHAIEVAGAMKLGWSFLAAMVAGSAIWCTHFVAMLAYLVETPVTYEPIATVTSLLIAVAGVYLGFVIASLSRGGTMPAIGGAIVGIATGTMHYVGMLAFRVDGLIRWEPNLVLASVALAAILSALAMAAARGQFGPRCVKGAFAVLILAILSLHFTGMAALEVISLAPSQPAKGQGAEALAIATALVGLLVIGAGGLAYIIDAQTRRDAADRLASMALTDSLTGLPNSVAFERQLEAHLQQCASDERLMVVAIGLSGIDALRQRYGRTVGDKAVQIIVQRLLKARKADVVIARTGGGELVAFGPVAHSDELAPRARRILAELSRRVQIDDLDISVDPRIGGAMFPRDAKKADDLIRCAKLALTRAAADPLEPIALFELSTEAATTRRQALADDVRGALQRGEFEVYYQPQVRAGDRGIIGHEALLRWRHPALGMVSPAEFIPVAEQTGIIVEIGEWVLKTACQTAAAWPSEWRVAVNLSPMQLRQSNLVERVQEALSNSGLSPNRLELELTESLLLDDRTRAQSVFLRIRAIGVRLALDDFGVGYSSMDVLRHFPFDKIKLDKSFIDDVEANPRSLAILRAMLTMGRSLSIPVLAEGVETERQLAILQSEGCAKIQGYLTGRPVPADRIDLGSRQLLAS